MGLYLISCTAIYIPFVMHKPFIEKKKHSIALFHEVSRCGVKGSLYLEVCYDGSQQAPKHCQEILQN